MVQGEPWGLHGFFSLLRELGLLLYISNFKEKLLVIRKTKLQCNLSPPKIAPKHWLLVLHIPILTWGTTSFIFQANAHTRSNSDKAYCFLIIFPHLLWNFNSFRHLPFDLYTFFNQGHLQAISMTANRGPLNEILNAMLAIRKPKDVNCLHKHTDELKMFFVYLLCICTCIS